MALRKDQKKINSIREEVKQNNRVISKFEINGDIKGNNTHVGDKFYKNKPFVKGKMTNGEITKLHSVLKNTLGHTGLEFNLGVLDNLLNSEQVFKRVEGLEKNISAIRKPINIDLISVYEKIGAKVEGGYKVENRMVVTEKGKEAEAKKLYDEVDKKHKKLIETIEIEQKKVNKFLDEINVDFKPILIDRKHLPTTLLTEQIIALKHIIK